MRHLLLGLLICNIFQFNLSAQDHPAFSSMDVFALEWVDQPQIAPDGSQIVYVRRGMDIMADKRISRLWKINADGTDHQKLTSNDQPESNPRWSPDGSRLIFSSSTDQGSEIFMYWKSSGTVARISQLPASPSGLSWSPDGKWIAFSMFVEGAELSLVKPPKKPKGAKWADAPRITTRLKHEADGSGYMKPGFRQLFLLSAEGGTALQITAGDFNHRGKLAWTPDSKAIVFSANRNKNWEYDFQF